jgi:bifunctional non-homologous end joining protein LigD
VPDVLASYRSKRDFDATPEPEGGEQSGSGRQRFVVHEHHARRLHWDLRLERDGVLVSWAIPKGIPDDPKDNRLAVHVEDHPLSYIDFEGEIPAGNYGAGEVKIWDRGTYEAHKFRSDEVIVTFKGERLQGKYALFQTRGKNWMIHRMDPPADPDREPLPEHLKPMLAKLGKLPRDEERWGFEVKWDGVRALGYASGGRLRLESRNLRDITPRYPELRALGEELGSRQALLDGEVVAFDEQGRPSFERLQPRMHLASESAVRRRMKDTPVVYVIFDLLHLEGRSLLALPFEERRAALADLKLKGPNWQVPDYKRGEGKAMVEATRAQGLEGVVAKRLDSPYEPGRRSPCWIKVKNVRRQEVVVGGWLPGEGGRSGRLGALLVGYHDGPGGPLRYAGRVGTGFKESDLELLGKLLAQRARDSSPFEGRQPPKDSRFVEPDLVAEVEFTEWTRTRTLRHPSYKGLRDDKPAEEVVIEEEEE